MKQNNEPFVRTMESLLIPVVPVPITKCHGCGQPVTKLSQEEADKLRKLESFEGLEDLGIAAFECRNCTIVTFEGSSILNES